MIYFLCFFFLFRIPLFSTPLTQKLFISIGITILLILLAYLIHKILIKNTSSKISKVGKEISAAKIILIMFFVLVLIFGLSFLPFLSYALSEILYYSILILTGVILAAKFQSKWTAPVFIGMSINFILALIHVFFLIGNPSAQFQYGPEIIFYAFATFVQICSMIPLDIAVIFSSWLIVSDIKRIRKKQ